MKRIKNNILWIIITIGILSCGKDSMNAGDAEKILNLGGETWTKTDIDRWISDSLVAPFNINIKYKWDAFEDMGDISSIIVPPKENHIIPILRAVRQTWITPYINVASAKFFNQISPKLIYMVGSPAFEESGAIKLGVAEGGKKIILLAINLSKTKEMDGYVATDSIWIKEMFHTIHHEFGHILHQNVLYPPDFKNLNPNLISSNWQDYSDSEALRDGFISAYSMNTIDDDFVEMISLLLVEGEDWFEQMLASIPDGVSRRGTTKEQAINRLRSKKSIVENYYRQVWNINFSDLQSQVRAAVAASLY